MDETEIDLRGLLGLLRRQLRLILGTIFVVIALAAIVVFSLTPVYTASTLLLVDPSSKNILDPTSDITGSSSDNARVESEVEIMRSGTFLPEVVLETNLISDEEFGVQLGLSTQVLGFFRLRDTTLPTGEAAVSSVVSNLRRAVNIQRRGLTYLVSVSVTSEDPGKAATLANVVAAAYIRDQLNSKINSTLAVRDILQSRIADASSQIVAAEESFDTFLNDNIQRISTETGRSDLAEMRQQLEAINSQRQQAAGIASVIESGIGSDNWSTVAETLQSQALVELDRQRQELQSQLASVVDGSETSINLRAELASIEASLEDGARTELSNLRSRIAEDGNAASELRNQLRAAVLQSNLPADVLTGIYSLQQTSEIARNQYNTLLSRLSEVEQQANLQVADSRVVASAQSPAGPSFPNPTIILTIAGFGALILGVGLAFLYEHFIGGFTSEGQVSSVLRHPVVSAIPKHKAGGRTGEGESVANMVITSPLSIYAESVRRIRAGIDQALRRKLNGAGKPDHGHVVMVSSAAPNEGKTTMALSLARAYALSGQRTLLIDCDLRKPGVHRQMGIEPSSGLLEYLIEAKTSEGLSDILFTEPESGLCVLVGARRSDIPTDQVVTSRAFADLISLAVKNFDIVVVDTPPVGPVVDGLYLAQYADVIAFVVRWATTSQQDARQAVHSLEEAKLPDADLLLILNQQEGSFATYRNKYSGYYNEAY